MNTYTNSVIPLLTRRPLRPKNANFRPALPNDINPRSLSLFLFLLLRCQLCTINAPLNAVSDIQL